MTLHYSTVGKRGASVSVPLSSRALASDVASVLILAEVKLTTAAKHGQRAPRPSCFADRWLLLRVV